MLTKSQSSSQISCKTSNNTLLFHVGYFFWMGQFEQAPSFIVQINMCSYVPRSFALSLDGAINTHTGQLYWQRYKTSIRYSIPSLALRRMLILTTLTSLLTHSSISSR